MCNKIMHRDWLRQAHVAQAIDAPEAQRDLIQRGNQNDPARHEIKIKYDTVGDIVAVLASTLQSSCGLHCHRSTPLVCMQTVATYSAFYTTCQSRADNFNLVCPWQTHTIPPYHPLPPQEFCAGSPDLQHQMKNDNTNDRTNVKPRLYLQLWKDR